MAWNAAIVATFGVPVPGREAKALENFADAQTFFAKLAADGRCSEPEAFLFWDGGGLMLVRGETPEVLFEILDMEEFRRQVATASFTSQDFHFEIAATGERLADLMSNYALVGTELGYL
jgi:hypothetical protein